MADGPFGIYTVPTPTKPKPPDWRSYITGYIVPGLIVLGAIRLVTWLIVG